MELLLFGIGRSEIIILSILLIPFIPMAFCLVGIFDPLLKIIR